MSLIFADDLTGACDAGAATGEEACVCVREHTIHHAQGVVVFNTENRTRTPEAARREVKGRLSVLGFFIAEHPIAYWKIDSLLRGNWAHEIAQLIECGAAGRFAIAPAFPEQERITAGGVQYARGVPVSPQTILQQLAAAGVSTDVVRVIDASAFGDLREAARSLAPDELPVGSAGFARAIWGPRSAQPQRVQGTVLVIVGTASQRGREQLRPLRCLAHVRIIEPGAQALLIETLEHFLVRCTPDAIVVAGGETLASVARVLSIESLIVNGELDPGVVLTTISGGLLDGRQIITKAGDFGSADTLFEVCRQLINPTRASEYPAE